MTDINAEADIFIEHSVNTKNQIIKLNIDVGMIRFMIDFLEEKNMPFKLLPTNLGLSDESISVSVATYNSLVLDRNRLLNNSSLQNPIIQNIDCNYLTYMRLSRSLKKFRASCNTSDLRSRERSYSK